ncbi:response regulator [Tahibacter amnicola]|uniref:Response regulator n=1 Tax=Tahibacter amnicola TaxID=2976241 RepID=A0ABY6B9A9_9GAMM|nr:response regulator [Tahibacter amnicola]UXI66648.1 response regulator [Tahibacter amnicola]
MNAQAVILLVEDNPGDVELTQRALRHRGVAAHTTLVARDGQQALDLVQQVCSGSGSPRPDVVLLDLHLPKIDGLEVLQQWRTQDETRDLPVVVMVSNKEQRDDIRRDVVGANGVLLKPLNAADFIDLVRELGLTQLVAERPEA